jgi:two-component system sensor histidine kinase BaeS
MGFKAILRSMVFRVVLATSLVVFGTIAVTTYVAGRKTVSLFNRYMAAAARINDPYPMFKDGRLLQGPAEEDFIKELNSRLALFSIPVFLLSLLGSYFIAWYLTGPVRSLTRGADEIAKGNLRHEVKVSGGGELAQLARTFNSMSRELACAQAMRKQFFADATHELKTPLTVIKGNLEGMLDGVIAPDREHLALLLEETEFLNSIVGDIRTLALMDSGQVKLELKLEDLSLLVPECMRRFRTISPKSWLKMSEEYYSGPLPAKVDADRLAQVLVNLLTNASHYTHAGDVIGIKTAPASLGDSPAAEITVWDTGSGIPADDLPYVFERFYRADKSRDRRTGGSGLGLAIVKRLVELHGGRVSVESTQGKGASFSVILPLEGKI